MVKIIIFALQYLSDGIFFIIFPIIFIYSWLRFFGKKLFHLRPKVTFSFLGIPMNFLSARAVQTNGFEALVIVNNCPKVFQAISQGFNLSSHPWLKRFIYLTDYLPLFIWTIFAFDIFESSFNGGTLMYSHLRKVEWPLIKLLGKKVVVYGYGSDCKILSEVKLMGKYNNAMDRSGQDENIDENLVRENLI